MTQMSQQASAVLNAMDEARVEAAIKLWDDNHLPKSAHITTRYAAIQYWCEYLGVADIDYWLDEWFKIPK